MTGPVAGVDVSLIECAGELARVARDVASAPIVALDIEANGLFAYRPRLCTLQLAWGEAERRAVVVVDAIRTDIAPLAPILGPGGPVKVLHDLTFDTRMLGEHGIVLGNVRDTSVAARLLGYPATGLSALLQATVGIALDKRLQRHDWSERPIAPELLQYLAGDVCHLIDLDARLSEQAAAAGIEAEIAEECAYKLWTGQNPPRDSRPAYVRVKRAASLEPLGRAVLRRLVQAREAIAEAHDVPPFKIASSDWLLDLARRRPRTGEELRQFHRGPAYPVMAYAARWLDAIAQGIADADIPEQDRAHFEPPRVDRAAAARRKALEGRISAWRRAEARRRRVDEQVVLPGHCAQDLAQILLATAPGDPSLPARIASIRGLGQRRLALYADSLAALLPGAGGASGTEGASSTGGASGTGGERGPTA